MKAGSILKALFLIFMAAVVVLLVLWQLKITPVVWWVDAALVALSDLPALISQASQMLTLENIVAFLQQYGAMIGITFTLCLTAYKWIQTARAKAAEAKIAAEKVKDLQITNISQGEDIQRLIDKNEALEGTVTTLRGQSQTIETLKLSLEARDAKIRSQAIELERMMLVNQNTAQSAMDKAVKITVTK